MLGNSRYEIQGRIDLEVFTVFPLFHFTLVDHFLGFLNVSNLLDVKHISHDILGDGLSTHCVFPPDPDTIIYTES